MAKTNGEKRKPKSDVRLKLDLSTEQKEVVASYFENDVIFINGDQGTGKSILSTYIALKDFLSNRNLEKIIITKPLLKSRINVLGSLPGDFDDKMECHVAHLRQCLYDLKDRLTIDKMFEEDKIEIIDINLIKGYTFGSTENTLIIVDEYQDMNYEDLRTILSRTGKYCKIIFTGSEQQVDKSINGHSCIHPVLKAMDFNIDGVAYHTLKENHRNEKVFQLINTLDSLK